MKRFHSFPLIPMSNMTKSVTWILGIVLVLVGVAGFFVGDMLFVFQVSTGFNLLHLVVGLIGLAAAFSGESFSRMFLIVVGLAYGVATIIGFVNGGDILGFFQANDADNYLHAAVAVVALGVGFGSKK